LELFMMGLPTPFYMHTDTVAAESLLASAKLEAADLSRPSREQAAAMLPYVAEPSNIGCDHLRDCLERPQKYGIPSKLTADFLVAFFTLLWRGDVPAVLNVFPRNKHRRGVLNVSTDTSAVPVGQPCAHAAPLVHSMTSESARGSDAFYVVHAGLVTLLRRRNALFFSKLGNLTADAIYAKMEALARMGWRAGLGSQPVVSAVWVVASPWISTWECICVIVCVVTWMAVGSLLLFVYYKKTMSDQGRATFVSKVPRRNDWIRGDGPADKGA